MDTIRLLLLEFVTPERWVYDSRYFPYLQGFADRFGIECEWLCFGTRFQTVKTGPSEVRQYMHLEGDDLQALAARVTALRPTHVILSHPITAAVTECLRGGPAPLRSRLLCVGDLPVGEGCELLQDKAGAFKHCVPAEGLTAGLQLDQGNAAWLLGRTDWLLEWLGVSDEELRGGYLVGRVAPSYRVQMGNAASRAHKPHLLLMGGLSCDHFDKAADNRHYAGLDLSSCGQPYGCAYCTWYRGPTSQLNADPVRLAEEQLQRLIETGGLQTRFCGDIDVHDIRLFRRAERFFGMVLKLPLPPTTFYFEPRLDRFLEVESKLDAVLPELAKAGHRICLFRMGAESLVEEENELYNKRITLQQLDETALRLKELARKHPASFEYDPTFGYITCSPWTTLEMLELGIRRAIERKWDPKGVWLYTPILFYRGSPITRLAMRDGLVVDKFEDLAPLYEPSVNQVAFDSFVGWRFKDERTAVAIALIVRFCAAALRGKYPDTIFEGDALYAACKELGEPYGFERPDQFALAVLATIQQGAAPYDKHEVLRKALELYGQTSQGVASPETSSAPVPHEKLTYLLQTAHARLAAKLPGVTAGEVRLYESSGCIQLTLTIGGRVCELELRSKGAGAEHMFETTRFQACFRGDSPVRTTAELAQVRALMEMLDRAMAAYTPEILSLEPRP